MMENYQEFLDRIDAFEKPELTLGNGDFSVSSSVVMKVCEDNTFGAFYGDTVVFELSDEEKAMIQKYVAVLYETVPECFCERLADSTFHMTLHDLSNAPVPEDVADRMRHNEHMLREMLLVRPIKHQTIRMRSKAVFNMVNTSLVAGLYPVDTQEYEKLMNLYHFVDMMQELPYPLTPHITLAYYHRNGFPRSSAEQLEHIVNQLNQTPFTVTLDTSRLVYQHFSNMNAYHTRFCLLNPLPPREK